MNWKELSQTQDYVFAGAVSGGLDSCTVAHWLSDKGVDVHCFTVDLGQPDEKKLDDVSTRMLGSGAKSSNILDGKNDLAEAGLKVIQSQARYEGGYWNTTGIARPVTVQQILPEMKKLDIDVLFHGATGRGNDQVRFQLASNMINPNVQVYAPWRDQEFLQQFPGRQQMLDYCEKNLIPIKPSKESRYSTDANFLGLTHEAGDLENISISPDFVETIMGQWPWNAKENPDYVTIKWDKGVPVEINGTQLSLVDAFTTANKIAGDHGVGIGTHVIEPIQGEGGIRVVPDHCLKSLREICDENDILLIFDEVQCGVGRTGKLFAYQWTDVEPDIMTIAKAIGNGFPLGACLTSKKIGEQMDFGSHGSTFGGNPLACSVGNAVLDVMTKDGFLDSINKVALELKRDLEKIAQEFPKIIEEIRGRGFILGIKCKVQNLDFVNCARENYLLTIKASDNVVRLLPPINLTMEDEKKAIEPVKDIKKPIAAALPIHLLIG